MSKSLISQGFRPSALAALQATTTTTAKELCLFGEFILAEQVLRNAVQICETVYGRETIQVDAALLNLGEFLLARGRFEEALPCFSRCLAIVSHSGEGASTIARAHRIQFIGQCRLAAGQATHAKIMFQRALQMFSIVGGQESLGTLKMLLAVAAALRVEAAQEAASGLFDKGETARQGAEVIEQIVEAAPIKNVSWPTNRFL